MLVLQMLRDYCISFFVKVCKHCIDLLQQNYNYFFFHYRGFERTWPFYSKGHSNCNGFYFCRLFHVVFSYWSNLFKVIYVCRKILQLLFNEVKIEFSPFRPYVYPNGYFTFSYTSVHLSWFLSLLIAECFCFKSSPMKSIFNAGFFIK